MDKTKSQTELYTEPDKECAWKINLSLGLNRNYYKCAENCVFVAAITFILLKSEEQSQRI
jgi:hypothetical protein